MENCTQENEELKKQVSFLTVPFFDFSSLMILLSCAQMRKRELYMLRISHIDLILFSYFINASFIRITKMKNKQLQVEHLKILNSTYLSQLRKLQSMVANGSKRKVHAGTCLAVLMLSVCLLAAPNLSPLSKKRSEEEAEQTIASSIQLSKRTPPLAGQLFIVNLFKRNNSCTNGNIYLFIY